MVFIKEINIEYKLTAIFGLAALVLSLFLGFFAGNGFSSVIKRSMISMSIFSLLGFASIYIIKRYVPEVYEFFSLISSLNQDESSISSNEENEENEAREEVVLSEDTSIDNGLEGSDPEGNVSIDESSSVESSNDQSQSYLNIEEDTSYMVNDMEKKIKYEPKIAAQAIRTMMKRDEK